MSNLKEIQELFDRAGLVLWEQQWRLIEQQLEIDQLTKEIEWGKKTNLVTFEEWKTL